MTEIDASEKQIIDDFLRDDFPSLIDRESAAELTAKEAEIIKEIIEYVEARFSSVGKYILGLAIDFTIMAQRLSWWDRAAKPFRKDLTEEQLFKRYELVKKRGARQANTLTLKYEGPKQSVGIRKIEESVADLFHLLKRTDYPSAPVYNTGQWQKYKDLLINCFRLSEAGRLELCKRLIHFGLSNMAVANFYGRAIQRVPLFENIVRDFPRSAKNENGGLTFQALAYGFIKADRPHLSIVTDKVRRGSKRQRQIGDIDCYSGIDLELSVEVKDLDFSLLNLETSLGVFIESVTRDRIPSLVFAASIDADARTELNSKDVSVLSLDDILQTISIWDWPKQNAAVLGMLHFLSHIEQNPDAVERLLAFIKERDPDHDALVYFKGTSEG